MNTEEKQEFTEALKEALQDPEIIGLIKEQLEVIGHRSGFVLPWRKS